MNINLLHQAIYINFVQSDSIQSKYSSFPIGILFPSVVFPVVVLFAFVILLLEWKSVARGLENPEPWAARVLCPAKIFFFKLFLSVSDVLSMLRLVLLFCVWAVSANCCEEVVLKNATLLCCERNTTALIGGTPVSLYPYRVPECGPAPTEQPAQQAEPSEQQNSGWGRGNHLLITSMCVLMQQLFV